MNRKKLLYNTIILFHTIFNSFLWFGWLSNNKLILEIHLSCILISICLFYLCKGCIITKIERLLSKKKWTIIDPILKYFNLNLTKNNREKITLILFFISTAITLYKLYV